MTRNIVPYVLLLFALSAQAAPLETPPEQQEAVDTIRPFASNVQYNRDGTVRFIRFSKPHVRDEHLKPLEHFPQLDYLAVISPEITDEGFKNVASLTNLDTLFVSGTKLTDQGLASFAKLSKLQRLYLDRTQLSNEGLRSLTELSQLQYLSLADTEVGDQSLVYLKGLTNLEILDLSRTKVTDAGLEQLSSLVKLKSLQLAGTHLTGSGLAQLKELAELETVDLSGTKVEADHLRYLVDAHPKLKLVLLYETSLNRNSFTTLIEKHPTVQLCFTPDQSQDAFRRYLEGDVKGIGKLSASGEPEVELPTIDTPAGDAAHHADAAIISPAKERFIQKNEEIPNFQRHVIPLLGRLGCNGRSCHGSFQGQGGFRLSMFGYDFAEDYSALVESGRVDTDDGESSLILQKPTLQEDHEGGERFTQQGWEHELLLRWIQGSAPATETPSQLLRMEVLPSDIVFQKAGDQTQLQVIAVWSDGTREDVTCLTRFQTNDDAVAEVSPDGLVTCKGPGDTYVVSFYDSGVVSTQTILPVSELTGDKYPAVPTPTRIDELVIGKLSKLGIVPSALSSDEEFLRRVSLDIAGTLPTPEEIEQFVQDESADKRERKIDELLERPAYVQWWTNLFCDLTGSNSQNLGTTDMNSPAAEQWRAWIERRVKDNVGWDKLAAGIILATSRRPGQTYEEYAAEQSLFLRSKDPADFTAHDNPMHYYWFRSDLQLPKDKALSFGHIFLGVRLQCAECHKHPFDQWSKRDFELFTEFFTRVKSGVSPEAASAQQQLKTKLGVPKNLDTAAQRRQMYLRVSAEGKPIPWNEIYVEPPGNKPQPARLLGSDEIDLSEFDDPREPLVSWLTSPGNPYFSRAIVNRVWAHYFNVGVVDPPDDFNLANPPSNKPLLDYLATEFVKQGYDLKWLHRTITNSRTYQLSWQPTDTNRHDTRNFSHAIIRRLSAEVTVDAILQSTADDANLAKLAQETAGRKIALHPRSFQIRSIDYSLLIFGKPLRKTSCDCERQMQPTLLQSLYVRNDAEILGWLERKDGWLAQVATESGQELLSEATDAKKPLIEAASEHELLSDERIEELVKIAYLRTLSRQPTVKELQRSIEHISTLPNPVEGLRDIMWALLNTQEFLTNH